MTPNYGSNLHIVWDEDPKMLGVRMARYKFVSRMFKGMGRVMEIGAGDGVLSKIVRKEVGELILTDKDPQGEFTRADLTEKPAPFGDIEGAYALDVLEHIPSHRENDFLRNVTASLVPHGTLIVGVPSLESAQYGSRLSKESHINCKTEQGLREVMRWHFKTVLMFGMNDEVVHTGFGPMCHYRLAVGIGPR